MALVSRFAAPRMAERETLSVVFSISDCGSDPARPPRSANLFSELSLSLRLHAILQMLSTETFITFRARA
jgi:hypothetical protein